MHTHKPSNYECPFCLIVKGVEKKGITPQADVFFRNNVLTAFVNILKWPNNPTSVVVVPNIHYENAYLLPDDLCGELYIFSNKVAVALKEILSCEGVTIRQHNEPAGGQEVWHYHIQVLPRWAHDRLYQLHDERSVARASDRARYALQLRNYFTMKEMHLGG